MVSPSTLMSQNPLKSTPTRTPLGGATPTAYPNWSSSSYWFYRRRQARRHRLDTATALAEMQMCVDENGNPDLEARRQAAILTARYNALAGYDDEPHDIIAGAYLPPPLVGNPGHIPEKDGNPEENHLPTLREVVPGYDANAHEDPCENQSTPVCQEMLSQLQTFAAFKPRTTDLVLSLKNKAVQLAKGYNNPASWKHHQVVMCTALAFEPTSVEMLALKHISASAVATKWTWVNDRLAGGNKDLKDCVTLKPKLMTRFLDWLYPAQTPQKPMVAK